MMKMPDFNSQVSCYMREEAADLTLIRACREAQCGLSKLDEQALGPPLVEFEWCEVCIVTGREKTLKMVLESLKCQLIQPLLSDQRRELISEHRRYRCFSVGTCELRRLFLSEHRLLRRGLVRE